MDEGGDARSDPLKRKDTRALLKISSQFMIEGAAVASTSDATDDTDEEFVESVEDDEMLRNLLGGASEPAPAEDEPVEAEEKPEEKVEEPSYATTKRYKIVQEIESSERKYLGFLKIMLELRTVLTEDKEYKGIFTPDEIKLIFKNLLEMIRISELFLEKIEPKVRYYDPETVKFGTVFIKIIPFLRMYQDRVMAHDNIAPLLLSKGKRFVRFNAFCFQKYKQEFSSLLIMPIQRLPRYELLLRELLKHTPEDHIDYESIREALDGIKKVNEQINEQVRQQQNNLEILKVIKKFSKIETWIFAPHRRYIMEGNLMKVSRKKDLERYFVLFNDILIYGRKVGFFYVFSRSIELRNCRIQILLDKKDITNQFLLTSNEKSFTLYVREGNGEMSATELRDLWVRNISKAISESKKRHADSARVDSVVTSQKLFVRPKGENFYVYLGQVPVWIQDDTMKACMICAAKFTPLNRRHHCRLCGKIVCSNCSRGRLDFCFGWDNLDKRGRKRICDRCLKRITKTKAKIPFLDPSFRISFSPFDVVKGNPRSSFN